MSETQMMNVEMASSGSKKLRYWAVAGTNYVDAGGNVHIYLGTEADTTTWARFERNVEQDWEGVATGVTWSNTDALAVTPTSTLSYDFWFDDIRLSNGITVEHNVMGPGVIAHILRHRERSATTYAVTDRWFHYDQVGSVLSESDSTGNVAQTHHQDAFGNTLASWSSGLIGGDRPGWHHNTKEWDGDVGLVYMYQRWYSQESAAFISRAPMPPFAENPYSFCAQNPLYYIDPHGTYQFGFSCYAPLGGKISYGVDEFTGARRVTIRIGLGVGGGVELNPFPGNGDFNDGLGITGVFGDIGFGAGPLKVGCSPYVGITDLATCKGDGGFRPVGTFKSGLNYSLSASAGFEFTHCTGPTKLTQEQLDERWRAANRRCQERARNSANPGQTYLECMRQEGF